MGLESLLEAIKDLIAGEDENHPNNRPANEDPQRDPAEAIPSSQDHYGDPAGPIRGHDVSLGSGRGQGARLASEDPLGDPGDVLPANQDPLSDPADPR